MSLIKINNLIESDANVLSSLTELEFQSVSGGYRTRSAPTGNLNSLNNYGVAVSNAFGYAMNQAGNVGLTVGGGFSGQYGVNGATKPFVSNVYWNGTLPSTYTTKK
jgi:hypothetical protein